jgi:4-diphosphocytidyl-2-C-methyl-D-erythritol kinase
MNDFEKNVFEQFPAIREIKNILYDAEAIYASMTGSGSTVYGIFKSDAELNLTFPANYFIKTVS